MTRNQLAIVQSLFVIGILLLLLGVATCVQKYVGVGSVFGVLGVIAVLAASAMWLRLRNIGTPAPEPVREAETAESDTRGAR